MVKLPPNHPIHHPMNTPLIDIDLGFHVNVAVYSLPTVADPRIRQAACWIAKEYGYRRLYASIAIVDDSTIQQVNAQRLGHDWPTDVISFELDVSDTSVEGEVIASVETAARICAAAGWSVADELLLYVVHGLLHVAGLNDGDEEQRQEMRLAEQACLLGLGVEQAGQHIQRFDVVCNGEAEW